MGLLTPLVTRREGYKHFIVIVFWQDKFLLLQEALWPHPRRHVIDELRQVWQHLQEMVWLSHTLRRVSQQRLQRFRGPSASTTASTVHVTGTTVSVIISVRRRWPVRHAATSVATTRPVTVAIITTTTAPTSRLARCATPTGLANDYILSRGLNAIFNLIFLTFCA